MTEADKILAQIAKVRQRIALIEETWISPAQKKWALEDAWTEIADLEEDLDALAREQEKEDDTP